MLDQDLGQLVKIVLLIVGAILPIVNPIGSAPMFLAMTNGSDSATRRMLARHVAFNSFLLLFGSLVFGHFVLRIFDLSVPVVQLAGGLVLCAMGWRILGEDAPAPDRDPSMANPGSITQAFYPLTLPLTVDPGAISVAITIGANHAQGISRVLIAIVGGVIGVTIIAITVWLTYRYAERVAIWLGHTRMMAVLRLSAFIVLCIGVQIAWNGVKGLIEELPLLGVASPGISTALPAPPSTPAAPAKP
jgi:multiple antibiotic resistance protein